MLRRFIALVLILALIVTAALTVYQIATTESASPTLLGALIVSAVFNLVQGADYVRDRLIVPKQVQAKPASAGTVEEYIHSKTIEMRAEEKLYVALSGEARIDPRLTARGSRHEAEREFKNIREAVTAYNGRFVLVGAPGAGKSTVLRALMRGALQAYDPQNLAAHKLPIWIDLGLSTNPPDAKALLDFWWTEQCYLPDTPDRHIAQKNMRLFLDGLNEMPEAGGSRADRAKSLADFIKRHPEMPIIVTCRESDYRVFERLDLPDEKSEKAEIELRRDLFDLGLPVVQVREMDEGRIREFITKKGKDADAWWAVIERRDALKRIAANPLTLSVMIKYFVPKESPKSLNELYKHWLKEAYRRSTKPSDPKSHYEDASNRDYWRYVNGKPLEDKVRLPRGIVERKLKKLAYHMIAGEQGTSAPWKWAQRQIGWRALEAGIALGLLIVQRGKIRFYHQSLQGYFAVEGLDRVVKAKGLARLVQNPVNLIRQIGDLGENGAPLVDTLIDLFVSKDKNVRVAAAKALGAIGQPALEPLIEVLNHEHWIVRGYAALAIQLIGHRNPALKSLFRLIKDDNPFVRARATVAIGVIWDSYAIESLLISLKDPVKFVRDNADYALAHIIEVSDRSVETLINAFRDNSFTFEDEMIIVRTLGKVNNANGIQLLIAALRDENWSVRVNSAKALKLIGTPEALEALENYDWRKPPRKS